MKMLLRKVMPRWRSETAWLGKHCWFHRSEKVYWWLQHGMIPLLSIISVVLINELYETSSTLL